MVRASLAEEIVAVRWVCRNIGLGEVSPMLLKAAHRTTLLARPLAIVARVQSAEESDATLGGAVREIAVSHHLARRGAPAVAALEGKRSGPHPVGTSVVTLWPYHEHERTGGEMDAALAAETLAAVHRALRDYDSELPPYTQTLDRCRSVLDDGGRCAALGAADRAMLRAQFDRLLGEIEAAGADPVPLHGDAHLGNLLIGPRGGFWTDFENACLGPREMDIADLPAALWSRFEGADLMLVRRFADLRSVCVAVWCSADIGRSAEIRDAAAYHLGRVRDFAR